MDSLSHTLHQLLQVIEKCNRNFLKIAVCSIMNEHGIADGLSHTVQQPVKHTPLLRYSASSA